MPQTLASKPKDHFLDDWAALPPNGRPSWIKALRRSGLEAFRAAEYPHTRMEEWRQTNINDIVATPYRTLSGPTAHGIDRAALAPHLFGEGWAECIVANGFHDAALSRAGALPAGVVACGLADAAMGAQAGVVERHLGKYLQDRSAYTALNSAFLLDGAFVYVPKGVRVETPIHLVFATAARADKTAAHTRVLIVLDEGAEAAVVCSHLALDAGANYLNNVVEEIALGPNAGLDCYKLVREGAAGNHLATAEVHLERDSRFRSHAMTLEGAVVRNQLCTALDGSGADVSLVGLYLNDGDRLIDNALKIAHLEPHCTSRIMYKGILDGKSHAVFSGHVYVKPDAQKTDSNQLSNNLLLSDSATVDAKPQLEIFADDVKCTHGATVGSPPDEVVFYFRARGIDEATARGMLTYGFAGEIVDEIDIAPVRAHLDEYIYRRYSPQQ